jgi:hypothetical protein
MKLCRVLVAVLMVLAAQTASAQDPEHGSFVTDVVRAVVLDPTTYAPAFVAWEATRLDWRSSQVFFENGWRESNQRFTLSGRGNDVAVSYVAGNRTILMDALANLQLSAIHNVSERVIERVLLPRTGRIDCRPATSASGRRMSGSPGSSAIAEAAIGHNSENRK